MRIKSYHQTNCCAICEYSFENTTSDGDPLLLCTFAKSENQVKKMLEYGVDLESGIDADWEDVVEEYGTCEKWKKEEEKF